MWKCRECDCEVFEVKIKGKEIVSRLNKNSLPIEIIHEDRVLSEIDTFYRCDGCGNEGHFIDDIAEWEED